MKPIRLSTIACLISIACLSGTAFGKGYLKIPDIDGEVIDPGYEDWIEVQAKEWVKPCPTHVLGADGTVPVLPELKIRKATDLASTSLMRLHGLTLAAELGLNPPPPFLKLTYVQTLPFSEGEPRVVAIWDLSDVAISSWSTSGDADDRPTEEVAFSFGAIRQSYMRRAPNGDLVGVQSHGFVLREGSTIPPPPDVVPGGSMIDSMTIGDLLPPDEATMDEANTQPEESGTARAQQSSNGPS